jgi:serine/threonine-protein kinase
VAYWLLTGKTPFTGSTVVEVCAGHLHATPEPPSRTLSVPADLEALVLACLAKKPDDRPASAAILAERLRACAVDRWTGDQARTWWATKGTELRARRESARQIAPTSALVVDLTRH